MAHPTSTAETPPQPWRGNAGAIGRALRVEAKVQSLGANRASLTEGAGRAWLVLNGSVDLFYLIDGPVEAARGPNGIRHHILRADAGDVFFGLGDPTKGWRVLAVPGNGTEAAEVTRDEVLGLVKGVGLREAEAAVAQWIEQIARIRGIDRAVGGTVQLEPGHAVKLAAGSKIVPAKATVFVDIPADAVLFADGERVETAAPRVWLPVRDEFWFAVRDEIEVTPLAVSDWLHRPGLQSELDALHGVVLTLTARAVVHEHQIKVARAGKNRDFAQTKFSGALQGLADVIAPRRGGVTLDLSSRPLIAAAGLVFNAMGAKLALNSNEENVVLNARDPVAEIARIAGVLYRRVTLGGDWWRQDRGPFLAWYGEDRRPCAIVPKSPRRCWLIDGETLERRILDEETAKAIEPGAYVFTPSFPTGPLRPLRILRFGVHAVGRDAWGIAGTIVATGILSLVTPVITGWIMSPVIPQGQIAQLLVLITAQVIGGLSTSGFSLIQGVAMLRVEGAMNQRVQSAVWDKLLKLPASFFRKYSIGDLANRAQGIDQIRQIFSGTVTSSLMHSVAGLFSFGLMFYYSWMLTLVIGVIAIIFVIISFILGRMVKAKNRVIMKLTGALQGVVVQLLNGVSRLRIAGAEKVGFSRWAERYGELTGVNYHQLRLNNIQTVFKSVFTYFGTLSVFVVIGLETNQLFSLFYTPQGWSDLSSTTAQAILPTATFVAFNVAYGQFLGAVFGLSQTALQLLNVAPLYERVEPILTAEEETRDGASEDPGQIQGRVEMRDVQFRYAADAPLVLNGLTLTAELGQFVAVVGPSGAGKSSLIRLLLGFEMPELGSIFVDGKDIRYVNKRALRRQFGVVLQNGRILSGSIFHNITAGANMTRDDAWEAARIAGLDKDIDAMPMGMDTFLNEGATTISGGQRQRLMIARAVVRRPSLLIFDEATSQLDNETQDTVTRNLESLKITRIVVAHRLSTIARADVIYVIVDGRVVEQGNFQSLMAQNGVFADLARRQMI
jgi:NHLM bacteriocin system ABC transporter ATP-binding protein